MILFTSGTTGRPKGATLTHRNMVHMGSAMAFGRAVTMLLNGIAPPPADGPPPASICATPFFHISGTAPLFMTGARFGSSLVFPPPGRWDPGVHLQLTAEHRVSAWSGVPTQFWRMLEHPDFESYDLSSLTMVSSGGAPFPPELMRVLNEKIPTANLSNGYGMSETHGRGHAAVRRALRHPPRVGGGAVPDARGPDPRRRPQRARPRARSARSACTARWSSRATGTIPTPPPQVLDDERWYHSGDYGRIEDGVLWLESRMRDLIIRGGENIYPMEIEHRLIEHPDIADAAVIGVEHRTLGQEVKAVVVAARGRVARRRPECGEWAAQSLAAFKVPTYVEFRDSLPYTQTGKVMKHQLEAEQAPGSPLPRRRRAPLRDDPRHAGADADRDRPGERVTPADVSAVGFSGGSSCLVVRHVVTATRRTSVAASVPDTSATPCHASSFGFRMWQWCPFAGRSTLQLTEHAVAGVGEGEQLGERGVLELRARAMPSRSASSRSRFVAMSDGSDFDAMRSRARASPRPGSRASTASPRARWRPPARPRSSRR